jgi:hypothetical protein
MSEQKPKKRFGNQSLKPKIDFIITFVGGLFGGLYFEYIRIEAFTYICLEIMIVLYILATLLRPDTPRAEDAPGLGVIMGFGVVAVTSFLIHLFF